MNPPERHELTSRELERLINSVDKLNETIVALRNEIAQTYVRKDVWLEARKNDADAGLVLSEQVRGLVSLRDWTVKIVVGAVLVALLGLVLVSNGGAPT